MSRIPQEACRVVLADAGGLLVCPASAWLQDLVKMVPLHIDIFSFSFFFKNSVLYFNIILKIINTHYLHILSQK